MVPQGYPLQLHLACRELEALAGSKQHCNTPVSQDDLKPPPCKRARAAGKEPNPAGLRHIETEQRRRDRINEGCATHSALMYGSVVTFLSVGSLEIAPACFGAADEGC